MISKKLKIKLLVVVVVALFALVLQYDIIQIGAFSLGYRTYDLIHMIKK